MITHGRNIQIFAANASKELAAAIADDLHLDLSKCEVKKFSDGETYLSFSPQAIPLTTTLWNCLL